MPDRLGMCRECSGAAHRLIAGSAGPCGVPAPVPEARLVPHQHSIGAESVPVWAPPWWLGYSLPVGGSDELTPHREQLTVLTASRLGPPLKDQPRVIRLRRRPATYSDLYDPGQVNTKPPRASPGA